MPPEAIRTSDHSPRVLIAVSDDGVRESLHTMLQEAGYDILEAASGLIAFTTLLASRHPLTVLLDSHLSGTNAAGQLLSLAAVDGPLARHQYVLLTTETVERSSDWLRRIRAARAVRVIEMPFDVEDVLRAVAQLAYHDIPA